MIPLTCFSSRRAYAHRRCNASIREQSSTKLRAHWQHLAALVCARVREFV
jgi:hypothetical protein